MEKKGFKGVRNVNGRPAGSSNKVTAEAKAVLSKVISGELEYLELNLDCLPVKERLEILIKLLPYILPRQHAVELNAEVNTYNFTPVTIIANEPIKILKDETDN